MRPSADRVIYRNVPAVHTANSSSSISGVIGALNSPESPDGALRRIGVSRGNPARLAQAFLAESRSTWKVICSDMPLALLVSDGATNWEAFANGENGAPLDGN